MNFTIKQGTNEAWFIYDGNKVKLGSHDKELIEKVFQFLKTEATKSANQINNQ